MKQRTKHSHWKTDQRINTILRNIEGRCNYPGTNRYDRYGGRGIRSYLDFFDLEYLWVRDGASHMKRPSIDRINNDGHYEVNNCQFLELEDNIRRREIKVMTPTQRRHRAIERAFRHCRDKDRIAAFNRVWNAARRRGISVDYVFSARQRVVLTKLSLNGIECILRRGTYNFQNGQYAHVSFNQRAAFQIVVLPNCVFIIPDAVLEGVAIIYLPSNRRKSYGTFSWIPPRCNWLQYKNAWHLLSVNKAEAA